MEKLLFLLSISMSEGHLVNQFIWFFGGSLVIIIFSFIMFQLLWKSFKVEAIKSSKISVVTALLLIFVWFTVLLNALISVHLIIIIGIIIVSVLFITVSKLE
ncbi:MAG: hypothetical protein ABRQ39_09675 [Candidatus Eremiobacterota bacterium]